MKLLDEDSGAGTTTQLSFSFDVSANGPAECPHAAYEAVNGSMPPALETLQANSMILHFPQDRRAASQSQLIQNILQRYRFF